MISPLENNGIISRAQDISIIKQNEDTHANLTHQQTQDIFEGERDSYVHTVHNPNDTDEADTHHDAREKGRNEYVDLREKKRKEKKRYKKE